MAPRVAPLLISMLAFAFASEVYAQEKTPKPQVNRSGATDRTFYEVVQPVLDEYCVRCHGDTKPASHLDLTGDRTRFFSMAYDGLWERGMIPAILSTKDDDQGKGAKQLSSPVGRISKHIDGKHYDVKLKKEQRDRIQAWIDSDLNYHGIQGRAQSSTLDGRDLWADPWFARRFMPIYREKCVSCHGKELGREPYPQRSAWINLSRPKHSRVLLAHLAKDEGGWGIDKTVKDRKPPVFAGTADPTYRAILEALEQGRQQMLANPRVDMPGAKLKSGHND